MPSLAARVALDGRIDAAAIGVAARALKRDPAAWSDRGDYATVLQELKLLWHVLVRFGRPRAGERLEQVYRMGAPSSAGAHRIDQLCRSTLEWRT